MKKKHPLYHLFMNAKYRCTKPTHTDYYLYGGRGIEFRFNSFEEFLNEVGTRPDGYTLDRIDNNGHYEVGNVRWASAQQQRRNQRPKFNKFGITGLTEIKPTGKYISTRYVVRITDKFGKRMELYKGINFELAQSIALAYTNKMKVS